MIKNLFYLISVFLCFSSCTSESWSDNKIRRNCEFGTIYVRDIEIVDQKALLLADSNLLLRLDSKKQASKIYNDFPVILQIASRNDSLFIKTFYERYYYAEIRNDSLIFDKEKRYGFGDIEDHVLYEDDQYRMNFCFFEWDLMLLINDKFSLDTYGVPSFIFPIEIIPRERGFYISGRIGQIPASMIISIEDVNSIHVMPVDSSQDCNYYANWLKKDGEYYREYYDSIQQIILGRNNRVLLDSFGIRILGGELVQAHDKERLKILYLAEASNAITSGIVTDKGEIEQIETIYAFPDSIELSTEYSSTNEFNYLLIHQSVYQENKMDDVDIELPSMVFLFDQSQHLIEVIEFGNCN